MLITSDDLKIIASRMMFLAAYPLSHDPSAKQIKIDIAAAQDNADLATSLSLSLLHQRGERRRTSPFGEIVGVGPVGAIGASVKAGYFD